MNRRLVIGVCIAAAAASVAQVPDKHAAPAAAAAPAFPSHLLAAADACPPPAWPREALLYDLQGSTMLSFAIGPDGAVVQPRLLRTSGWKMLDDAALAGIAACRFKPGLDSAQRAGPYPMQFDWKLDGDGGVTPVLRAGSCRASPRFARFAPFDVAPTSASGVLLRFVVGAGGVPSRIAAEANGQPDALLAEAIDYVQSCRFDYDPAGPGTRSASVTGRVLAR
ncbi:energy transducer TonB [Massilia sp. P8910]|uniref:energy transducer TonB n=1 Tax=Massilia antarctica TaxID=2765360 RepID=UPI001E3F1348|nr:TonB family protein [Massilia antarctica]MCE3604749.1 energy transducer TonB [Massilia antarctica]